MIKNESPRQNRYATDALKRLRRTVLVVLLASSAVFLALFLVNDDEETPAAKGGRRPASIKPGTLDPGPFQQAVDRRAGLERIEDKVRTGDTLSQVFERMGLNQNEAHLVAAAAGQVLDLTKVQAGSRITLWREKKTRAPVRIEYQHKSSQPRLVMIKTQAGYAAGWEEYEPVKLKQAMSGQIKSTLWGSAVQLYQLDPELVMTFADLFAYDIDFFTDIQEGDEFGLLYEQKFYQGRSQGPGRIYAAYFVNNGKRFEVYHFINSKGEEEYFDAEGNSHRKMFLKSPLQYRRISSFFSHSRMHPILKYRRPHLGVDYAAPSGTPVETVASGTITFIGSKGGYGKMVVIKHNKTYTTQYAHLSAYAKGLKKGDKVQQGDLIGYVGATGLATGPHLDFRMTKEDKFVDPLKELAEQSAIPLDPAEKPRFLEQVEALRVEMSSLLSSSLVVAR
ncbi:MAG: peptidoglycan DD-metalloendopeptidase family protein [Thermodesulfobacteriota bacterium]